MSTTTENGKHGGFSRPLLRTAPHGGETRVMTPEEAHVALYGHDGEERIVGIQRFGDDKVRIYKRDSPTEKSYHEDRPLYPWITATPAAARVARSIARPRWQTRLDGTMPLNQMLVYDSWRGFKKASKGLRDVIETSTNLDWNDLHSPPNVITQYLTAVGKTMFKGMAMSDLRRVQIDIEVAAPPGYFPDASRDEIIIIAIYDSHADPVVLSLRPPGVSYSWTPPADYVRVMGSEILLLREFVKEIHRRDPDVLELHNGFGFDLPYIKARMEENGVPFGIGRDSSEPWTWEQTKKFAERDVNYTNFSVQGRSVIDTMFLLVDYDVIKRDLPSLGLKDAARYFGFAREDRVYVEGDRIAEVWRSANPDDLLIYAKDDVWETKMLADKLLGATFYEAQSVPMGLQNIHTAGVGTRIEAVFIREYMRQKYSLPQPTPERQDYGGLTGVYKTGVLGPVVYADVSSLYPSVMLNFDIRPRTDILGVFQGTLTGMTHLRLETKAAMGATNDTEEKAELDARQNAFKKFINSFYGYLGFSRARFGDWEEADRVATTGQNILRRMMGLIEMRGGEIIEADTDGIMYRPAFAYEDEHDLLEQAKIEVDWVNSKVPRGISIDLEGVFPDMLSYKSKNYALRSFDGKVKIKGSGFKSRMMEPFAREYLKQMVPLALDRNIEGMQALYHATAELILSGEMPIEKLVQTATLKRSVETYLDQLSEGETNIATAYEVAKIVAPDAKEGYIIKSFVGRPKVPPSPRARTQQKAMPTRDARPLSDYPLHNYYPYHYLIRLQSVTERFRFLFGSDEEFGRVFALPDTHPEQQALFGPRPMPDLSGIHLVTKDVDTPPSIKNTNF